MKIQKSGRKGVKFAVLVGFIAALVVIAIGLLIRALG